MEISVNTIANPSLLTPTAYAEVKALKRRNGSHMAVFVRS